MPKHSERNSLDAALDYSRLLLVRPATACAPTPYYSPSWHRPRKRPRYSTITSDRFLSFNDLDDLNLCRG